MGRKKKQHLVYLLSGTYILFVRVLVLSKEVSFGSQVLD